MFIMIVGLVVFAVGVVMKRSDTNLHRFANITRLGGIALVLLGFFFSTFRQIDSGNVGVIKLFGQVQKDRVLYEGLNMVNPVYNIEVMNIRQLNYTMSSVHDEGTKAGDDAVRVRCNDGLEVAIDMTVLYRVVPTKAPDIFQTLGVGFEEQFVRPVIRSRIRESAVYYSATDLYSGKRAQFEAQLRDMLIEDFEKNGFELKQVLIRNVVLPQTVTESIERKIAAIQEAQRQDYVLEKVKKEAEMKRQEAQGTADAQQILSSGLSDRILQFEAIKVQKELVNSPNSKIIIMGGGRNTPFILDTKDSK